MIDPSLFASNDPTGSISGTDLAALQKALTAGYGTDSSQLTGGGALRIQSLDKTMQTTIQENKHFRLFNRLPKPKVGATVDEWTEQNGIGGYLGGTTNGELGVIAEATGSYNRRVGLVKYLMTKRQVSFVTTLQNSISEAEATEQSNGALQLLSDAEFLSFEGDSTVVPTEFDGIAAQMAAGVNSGQVDGSNIIDVQATTLNNIDFVTRAAANIAGYGNFGTPTDIFVSQLTQADFDTGLDPAYRVPLTNIPEGGIKLGSPVVGIRTSWGDIANQPDVFIRDGVQQQPFEIAFPVVAAAQAGLRPSAVAGTPVSDASSMFTTDKAGNYYYYVAGINAAGHSTGLVSAQVAVAAGQSVQVVITRSASAQETGYVIYRSRLNGAASILGTIAGQGSDFRQMARIGVAGATTTYVDQNRDIPGTSKAFILNLSPSATAVNWRQLLPMMKFQLYPTVSAVIPWAQLLFGYLRISKRRHNVVIKNILPSAANWRPFNV